MSDNVDIMILWHEFYNMFIKTNSRAICFAKCFIDVKLSFFLFLYDSVVFMFL